METLARKTFYDIAEFLSEKDIFNLCKTCKNLSLRCNEEYFIQKHFKRYSKVDAKKYRMSKIELIEKLVDGCGLLYKVGDEYSDSLDLFDICNVFVHDSYLFYINKNNILAEEKIDGDDKGHSYNSRLYKYFSQFVDFNINQDLAKNILMVNANFILTTSQKLYKIHKKKEVLDNLIDNHPLIPDEIIIEYSKKQVYELKLIANDVRHLSENFYITNKNELYRLKLPFECMMHNVKLTDNHNHVVDHDNVVYTVENHVKQIYKSDINIVDIEIGCGYFLILLDNNNLIEIKENKSKVIRKNVIKIINDTHYIIDVDLNLIDLSTDEIIDKHIINGIDGDAYTYIMRLECL